MQTPQNRCKHPIIWLSTAHLINDTYTGFLNPIMPFLAAKLGFSMAIATVVMSIAHICASLLQPLFGFFADNILKRFFIFWGLLLVSIFIPLAPLASNVYILAICVILGSLGSSFFHPQSSGFVVRFSQKNYSENMAYFISAGSLGFSFGPMIAGIVTQYFGLTAITYLSFIGIITALLMFSCVPKISLTDNPPVHKDFIPAFKKILSNSKILILILLSVMKSIMTNSCFILLPFLWKNVGYSAGRIGFYLFSFIFFGAIGSLVSDKLEHKIGAKKVFYISLMTMLPMTYFFVQALDKSVFIYYPIFIVMGFLTMLAMPVNVVMAQKIMPEYKSILAGFVNGFSWGISAILLTGVGVLAEKFGIKEVLVCVSVLPFLSAFFVRFLPDKISE